MGTTFIQNIISTNLMATYSAQSLKLRCFSEKFFEENIEPPGKRFYEFFKCPNANVEAAENSRDISVAGTRSRIVCLAALQRAYRESALVLSEWGRGATLLMRPRHLQIAFLSLPYLIWQRAR
ncbi:hypothetical protein CDAR_267701 [Caerostris darwini]|uniref:Uncharacterized protein n=1 Tax=Caerostris darwini TaxID=1538125 RepID=A0AAV4U436_9ARAC|nr:hypothetical protein CDAR_267701 [Caerostris darwini]